MPWFPILAGPGQGSYYHSVGSGKSVVHDIACVARVCGFKNKNFGFCLGHRAMLDTARDDAKLARLQIQTAVAKLNCHLAAPDQEHFILMFMLVPRKDSDELDELDFLAVQLGNDLWSPMFVDQGKLLVERGFG